MCVNTSGHSLWVRAPKAGLRLGQNWLAGRWARWSEQATSLLSLLSFLQLPWGAAWGHRAMSDLLLLGLIGGLTLLLLLTLLAFAGYSGLLAGVAVSAGSPPIRNVTVAYKFHTGPYNKTGRLFTESCSVCPRLRSIAVYYDSPHVVRSLLRLGRTSAPGTDLGQGLLGEGRLGF